jgi:hypothetical protein
MKGALIDTGHVRINSTDFWGGVFDHPNGVFLKFVWQRT